MKINIWNLLGAKDTQDALKQTFGANDVPNVVKQATGLDMKPDKTKTKDTKKNGAT